MKFVTRVLPCVSTFLSMNLLVVANVQAVPMPFAEGFDGSSELPASNSTNWSAIDQGKWKALDTSTDGDIFSFDLTADEDIFSTDGSFDDSSGQNAFFASNAQGWNSVGSDTTIEFRFRTSDASGYFQLFDIINGERRWNAGFDVSPGNLIFGTGGGVSFSLDSDFHTLRLLINSDTGTDSIDAYLDGVLVKSGWEGVASSDPQVLRIGDWSGSAVQTGQIDYDYISWTHGGLIPPIPEPSSVVLSALGILVLTRRRQN